VRAVHVGVRHYDDATVTELCDVEDAFVFAVALFLGFADPSADRRDHCLNFSVLEELIFARFLNVDEFAADRKDRLVTSIASLFRGAAS
jgi:hypothetical protein